MGKTLRCTEQPSRDKRTGCCDSLFRVLFFPKIAFNPIRIGGKWCVRTSCIIKRFCRKIIQCFPRESSNPARQTAWTHIQRQILKKKFGGKWKISRRTGKNKEISSFMGWKDVVCCKRKCERKILAGMKKYEKCNKFYYYDVSTSLVCIKTERKARDFRRGSMWSSTERWTPRDFQVNCLIKRGDLNLPLSL